MNILGHQNIIEFINNAHESDQLAHAYLFVGPKSVGKFTVAKHLANQFFCTGAPQEGLFAGGDQEPGDRPCTKCIACQQLGKGIHPDFYTLSTPEDKHGISIEQVRDVLKQIYRTPALGDKKIVIVDDAHQMSIGASNAFLKTLEEPPASSLLFLVTHLPDQLPQTILSRCQIFEFDTVQQAEIAENDKALWNMSQGRPGIFFEFKKNESAYKYRLDEMQKFTDILNTSKGMRLKLIEQWFKKGKKHPTKKEEWIDRLSLWKSLLREQIMLQLGISSLVTRGASAENSSIPIETMRKLIDQLSKIQKRIDGNINIRSHIELFYLSF